MTKRICTVCARAGSKGLSNKNIRIFCGKPMIAYSILQAKTTGLFECVAVSSDSDEILDMARQWGADFLIRRPAEMASDMAAKTPAIRHCVKEVERLCGITFDVAVDLSVTSPLRSPEDILGATRLLETKKVPKVITGQPSKCSPYFSLVELDPEGYTVVSKHLSKPIVRRQDSPVCYDMNGAVFVWTREGLFTDQQVKTLLYEMPQERSIDIDTEIDFEIAEFLYRKVSRRGLSYAN